MPSRELEEVPDWSETEIIVSGSGQAQNGMPIQVPVMISGTSGPSERPGLSGARP